MVSTWHFCKLTENIIFTLVYVSTSYHVCKSRLDVHTQPHPKIVSCIIIVCRILDIVRGIMITFWCYEFQWVMKQTNPLTHPIMLLCLFLFCFSVILFSDFLLSSKICYFHFPRTLNEKSRFDLRHVIVKIKSISPPETITDAMGQIIW